MQKNQQHIIWLPLALLLLLGFIWGTGYTLARYALTNGVSPLGYSFWQSLGPAILLFTLAKKTPSFTAAHWKYYFIAGLTGIAIPNTNMYFAAPHLPAGLLAVIVNTVPIMAYPIALLARTETFTAARFLGILLAMAGILFLILPNATIPAPYQTLWVLSALLTPLSFAFCAVFIARYCPPNQDSLSLAAGTLIFSSLLLSPLVICTGHFYHLHWPLTQPDAVIILEIFLSSAGYILFFQLIKIAGPVYYSLVDGIVGLTGLFWGYMIFHEHMNLWEGSAIFLILFALILVSKPQQPLTEKKQRALLEHQ